MARSNYNLEQLMSDFERRVEEDIQRGNLRRDKQVERYFRHFRQTLDELDACHGLLQLRPAGESKGEDSGSPSTNQSCSIDNDQMSSIDSEGSSVPKACSADLNSYDKRIPGELCEEIIPDNFLQSSALPVSNLRTSIIPCSISNQQYDDPLWQGRPGWTSVYRSLETAPEMNWTPQSAHRQRHYLQPLEFNHADTLESAPLARLEADKNTTRIRDPILEPFGGEYMMSDDLLADLLQIENEKPEAMSSWMNKNSGNEFLEQL